MVQDTDSQGLQNNLEFELRLQQYIELRRNGELLEARQHARKYIAPHTETHFTEIHRAAGLLAYSPHTQVEPYKVYYFPSLNVSRKSIRSIAADYVLAVSMEFSCRPLRADSS